MLWSWLDPAPRGTERKHLTAISVFLLAGAYLLLNASLAFNPQDALVTAAAYLAVVIATILTLRGLRGTSAVALRAMGSGFLAGMGVAALLLCFEFLSGHAIFEAVYAYVPWARLDPKHAAREGSVLHLAGAYLLNRNVSLLMLLLWPCMLVGQSLFEW